MKSQKEKRNDVLRHPYLYTKYYLINKINAAENRIISQILKRIKPEQFFNKDSIYKNNSLSFYFNATELILHNNVGPLENTLEKMRQRKIQLSSRIDGEESFFIPGLITAFERKKKDLGKNKGKVMIKIDEKFYQHLLNLGRGYTTFSQKSSFSLSNRYALKMYYHICHWFKPHLHDNSTLKLKERLTGKPKSIYSSDVHFDLESMRKDFNLPSSYRPIDIRREVLLPAKNELDKKAEVSFNFTQEKRGKKVTGFVFVFYRQIKKTNLSTTFKLNVDEKKWIEMITTQQKLTKEEKVRLVGLLKHYGYHVLNYITLYKKEKIEGYIKNNKSYIDGLGYICEGEKRILIK